MMAEKLRHGNSLIYLGLHLIQYVIITVKGYLHYKMITSQNLSSEVQVKNSFYFVEN